jgi:hypothetical protein
MIRFWAFFIAPMYYRGGVFSSRPGMERSSARAFEPGRMIRTVGVG